MGGTRVRRFPKRAVSADDKAIDARRKEAFDALINEALVRRR
jgi:hypothetical protein